jgi:hypothetical protein
MALIAKVGSYSFIDKQTLLLGLGHFSVQSMYQYQLSCPFSLNRFILKLNLHLKFYIFIVVLSVWSHNDKR